MLREGSERTLAPQFSSLYGVEWAADVSLLASGHGTDGKAGLYRLDLHSGDASIPAVGDFPNSAPLFALSPEGKVAIWHYLDTGFSSIDLATGSVRKLSWTRPSFRRHDLKFSNDGKQLALFQGNAVEVIDITTGKLRQVG